MAGRFTRRGFLGSGLLGLGAAATLRATAAPESDDAPGSADAVPIKTTVNGTSHSLRVGPDAVALDVLRDQLGLTGAKRGCGHGACGACTVVVDGVPRVSCLLPATALQGREVRTVEAIGAQALHPVQRAFMARDALQCGYCTPGFIVSASTFVDGWRKEHGTARPDPAQVADALAGHLCRCGAHPRILAAVADACEGRFDAEDPIAPRVDARAKVTGAARYTVDVKLPGQLEGVILRSPHAHAVVRGIDASAAQALPGVAAVVVLTEVGRTVRFAGQEIVAVAAASREQALLAAGRVMVDYDVRVAVIDLEDALSTDAPQVYPDRKAVKQQAPNASEGFALGAPLSGNQRGPTRLPFARRSRARKHIEEAKAAGWPVVQRSYVIQTQAHTTLEPHAAVAHWTADGLVVHQSTQSCADSAKDLAEHFDLPEERVRVHCEFVGGGFGGKQLVQMETRAAVELSRASGRPVRVALDRAAEIGVAALRPGARIDLQLASNPEGALHGLQATALNDGGCSIGSLSAGFMRGIYATRDKDLADYDVLTHKPPGKPFRGPGGPQMHFALEQAVDEVAEKRGESPITLRRRWDENVRRQRLYDWIEGLDVWKRRQADGPQRSGRIRRGLGVASSFWPPFVQLGVEARVEARDGRITVGMACQDMGNGSKSVAAAAVSEVFGLPPAAIDVHFGDSDEPYGPLSGGSRTAVSIAPAITAATRDLVEQLVAAAEDELGLQDARWQDGAIAHAGGSIPWTEVVSRTRPLTGRGRRRRDPGGYFLPFGAGGIHIVEDIPGAVQLVEVEVDTLTGVVHASRVWTGMSVGRLWVPDLATTQVEGAVVQGISYALYEDRRVDPATGRLLTSGLETYRIAGVGDAPEITVHFDDVPFDGVEGGGVGLSELATVSVVAAVANAVHDCTGVRMDRAPFRPDRLLGRLA